jgi:adenosine deaminase
VALREPTREELEPLRRLPKIHLHDHLDGGLRPATIVELAAAQGVELPTEDPGELESWFHRGANRGSLPLYLEGFAVTTAVMQTEESLRRVAREKAEDLAADGVIYGEVRFAPILHVDGGLNLEQVLQAVLEGTKGGCDRAGIDVRIIVCGMRHMDPSANLEMAELAVDFRDRGVVGYDLAGDEAGHPPKRHIEAFHYLQRENFNITIHAGEAFGLASIWQAIQYCGAHRIGHATRLVEDLEEAGEGKARGTLAAYIDDHRICLEMCLSSNVHTGAVARLEDHPFPNYLRRRYRVCLNVDNYLMSATTLSREWWIAQELFGLGLDDFELLALNAAKGAFCHHPERVVLIEKKLRPAFARARAGR